ncbi:hypothetical protein DSM100238_0933 [Bifidobacterium apri]|uniref:Uncharacterized protein n=1 Tax=Bifidobacterium apri TaxID=1769423 RepID=A0A6A2WEJ7_9BIFI|nr:hypothetical protein DSM100238_0933 [Bifidobacterium apri]
MQAYRIGCGESPAAEHSSPYTPVISRIPSWFVLPCGEQALAPYWHSPLQSERVSHPRRQQAGAVSSVRQLAAHHSRKSVPRINSKRALPPFLAVPVSRYVQDTTDGNPYGTSCSNQKANSQVLKTIRNRNPEIHAHPRIAAHASSHRPRNVHATTNFGIRPPTSSPRYPHNCASPHTTTTPSCRYPRNHHTFPEMRAYHRTAVSAKPHSPQMQPTVSADCRDSSIDALQPSTLAIRAILAITPPAHAKGRGTHKDPTANSVCSSYSRLPIGPAHG